MQILKQTLEMAEHRGWLVSIVTVSESTRDGWRCKGRHYVKLQKFSPAGEDFSMSIDFKLENAKETFLLNLKRYWDSFDVDSHVEKWISQRGKGGCPDSILELLTDAEQIRHSIFDLWSLLAGKQLFGASNTRFIDLLKEVNTLLADSPSEGECSKEENEVFADLANLKESLTRAGITTEVV